MRVTFEHVLDEDGSGRHVLFDFELFIVGRDEFDGGHLCGRYGVRRESGEEGERESRLASPRLAHP